MRRRARRAARADSAMTRRRILRAAEDLFAARGYTGVGMRRIARRAGVNVALPYYHFGSKERLYGEIVSGFSRRLGVVTAALADPEARPARRLDRAVDAAFDLLRDNVAFVQILLREVMRPSPAWLAASGRFIGPVLDAIDGVVRRGAAARALRPADGRALAVLCFGAVAYWVAAHRSLASLLGADPLDGPLYDRARAELKALLGARLGVRGER